MRLVLLSVLLASTIVTRSGAQPRVDPMAGAVAESFTLIERQFVALADAMPAEKYGFKPTTGEFKDVRTFAEQVKHVACANFGFYSGDRKEDTAGELRNRRTEPGENEGRNHGLLARVVHIRWTRSAHHDARKRDGANRRPVSGPEHAPRSRDAVNLARVGSLRAAGRLSPHERDRAARQPAVAASIIRRRISVRPQQRQNVAMAVPLGEFLR